jgi:hypothetical protein
MNLSGASLRMTVWWEFWQKYSKQVNAHMTVTEHYVLGFTRMLEIPSITAIRERLVARQGHFAAQGLLESRKPRFDIPLNTTPLDNVFPIPAQEIVDGLHPDANGS